MKTNMEEKRDKSLFKNVISILVVGGICAVFIYPALKLYWAHKRVEQFCSQVVDGRTIEDIKADAEELGLKFQSFPFNSKKTEEIMAWQGWLFARWNCSVHYENGKIVKKEIKFLD